MVSRRNIRQRGMGNLVYRLAFAAALLAMVWVAGLFAFAYQIPDRVEDATTRTDAIVVLTGGSGRLAAGLGLLSANMGARLFVSGVYQGMDVRRLLTLSRLSPAGLEGRINIGNATDTIGNASESAAWMKQNGLASLRLVTGAYHMPRSLLEFHDAMPQVSIVTHPVFPVHVKQDRWWAWPGTTELFVGEYNKFLAAWVRHRGLRVFSGLFGNPIGDSSKGAA